MPSELTHFTGALHEAEYLRLLDMVKRPSDPYWQVALYVLTACGLGRAAEPHLDFARDEIPQDLADRLGAVLSGGTRRMVRTALHLWNAANPWTVMDLRGIDEPWLRDCLHAIEHLVRSVG